MYCETSGFSLFSFKMNTCLFDTTGGEVIFSPRLGRVSFASGSAEAYVVIVPDQQFFASRFEDEPWSSDGEMTKFRSRRILISHSGFVRVLRYYEKDGKWVD